MNGRKSFSRSPLLFAAVLAAPACWPAAPITAIAAGRNSGGNGAGTTVTLSGTIVTDATVSGVSLVRDSPREFPLVSDEGVVHTNAAGPILDLSGSDLDFGATGTHLVVQARNSGSGVLTVQSLALTPTVGATSSWLTAKVLPDGKTITLTADRTVLAPGAYDVQVDVDSNGGSGTFFTDLTVGAAPPTPIGPVIVEVLASDGVTPVARITTTAVQNYAFVFPNLPRGRYFLRAGVDLDSDGVIGQPGEPFGAYPTASIPQLLEVDELSSLSLDLLVQ